MTDNHYDGIIIGSGQHGLILGSYLARAGLKIVVLERRLIYGGGLGSVEVTRPGFYHQLHSLNHFNITEAPWYRDLGLATRVRYVTPRYDFAQPHRDGTALVFSRYVDETCESIAKFSKKDARTYREWNRKADVISDHIFWPERYSEPLPEAERDELLSRSTVGRDFLEIINRQPLTAVGELFDSELVRLLLLFKISLFGTVLYDQLTTRSPMGALIRGFDLVANYQVAVGGSVSLARALAESFIRAGGELRTGAEVERIVVDNGRVVGVALTDGSTLRAGHFVASTVDVPQTFERMVGLDALPPVYRDKVRGFKQTGWSLFGLHLALKEPPRHLGSDFDPHVNESLKVNVGCESIEQLFALHEEVARGEIPSRVSFGTGSATQFDPSQAPSGRATAYAWHAMPYAPDGDPENIEAVKEEFADRMLEKWREFAPNMTSDNILGRYVYTANDYSRELINMVQGDIFMGSFSGDQTMWNHFGYRTPVDGLYMAGSPTHPGGAISGGGGYIASRIIAEDLGLPLWWEPVDARASLEKLAAHDATVGRPVDRPAGSRPRGSVTAVADLHLSLACWDYDRTRALREGAVRPEGIELTYLPMMMPESFFRMLHFGEFDVSEMSLSWYTRTVFTDPRPFVAIPVFPSRMFRHSCVYVNADSGIEKPADLVGRRVGCPEYQMTAAVWLKGILADHYDVPVDSVAYFTGGLEQPGRQETPLDLPSRFEVRSIGDEATLSEMLERGEIDALYTAHMPSPFARGSANVRRLFADSRAVEQDYYRSTGIFPIMHTVVLRSDVYERHRWIARSLTKAFEQAKDLAYGELYETTALKYMLPWLTVEAEHTREVFGTADFWPYGLERNQQTLATFLRYSHEQGLSPRLLEPAELFAPETLEVSRI